MFVLVVAALLGLGCQSPVTFLGNGEADTFALGQGYPLLGALANHKHVGQTETYKTLSMHKNKKNHK